MRGEKRGFKDEEEFKETGSSLLCLHPSILYVLCRCSSLLKTQKK